MGYIYKITNCINNKSYIGKTERSIEIRWAEHLRHSKYIDTPLYRAMRKYGNEMFLIETVEECDNSILDEKEIYWIDHFNTYKKGYNCTSGGEGGIKTHEEYIDIIIDRYLNGERLDLLCKEYHCDYMCIRRNMENKGILINTFAGPEKLSTSIYAVDPFTLQVVAEYESISAAGRALCKEGNNPRAIASHISKQKDTMHITHGFLWRTTIDDDEIMKTAIKKGDLLLMYRPNLIILCGISGSGKSTYAKRNASENDIILSSDFIREELYGKESIQGNPAEVFSLMQKRAVEALNNGHTVWYDSTAITRKDRAGIISVCPKFAKIECYIIWASIETCIERDAARERTVGKEVIDRMLKRFQAPFYDEGFDKIYINRTDYSIADTYTDNLFDAMQIPHDNSHHTFNIYEHCWSAYEYIKEKTDNEELKYAALIHDCGKPYVKDFHNTKGEKSESAHYYSHQNVGAWLACGLLNITPYELWLITTHMEPFFNSKYYLHLPPYLKRDIDKLHEADLAAH